MEENNKGLKLREINVTELILKLWKYKMYFFITIPIAIVISSVIMFSKHRFYVCEVKLAPESSAPNMSGLGGLASTLGLNMGNLASQDAISPTLYPDLIESVNFQVSMFTTPIVNKDGTLKTTYFNYLQQHQKYTWWEKGIDWMKNIVSPPTETEIKENKNIQQVNSFRLTKAQEEVAKNIGSKIKCEVDKKTDVITITVTDQDPLVCAMIADSARVKLQQFIIEYRTKKARIDLDYATKLSIEAKKLYTKAQQKYATYADANEDVVLQSFIAKRDELENEMQLQYNNYEQTTKQMMLAKAKLQERTPAFTTLQSASVPVKHAGPKRVINILFWMFVTFVGTSIYIVRKKQ